MLLSTIVRAWRAHHESIDPGLVPLDLLTPRARDMWDSLEEEWF